MTDWFRSWHGAPTDPKWRTVAKRAKVAPSLVVSVAWALMDSASQNEMRGSIAGLDIETLADFNGCEPEEIEAVIAAMHDKGILSEGAFSAWSKRQPAREDGSAERAKAWREQKKLEKLLEEREVEIAALREAERARTQDALEHEPKASENAEEREQTNANAKKHRAEQSRAEQRRFSAALRVRAQEALDQLEIQLRQASGFETEDYPGLQDLSSILGLIDEGFDLEDEILPTIRAKRRKGVRSWSWFVPSIQEARQVRSNFARNGGGNARAGPDRPRRGVESALAGIGSYFDREPE